MSQWYWCFRHDTVETEMSDCPPTQRLGPYESEEAARDWKALRDERNEKWDRDESENSNND